MAPSEYLCSVISSVQRIPAFDFVNYRNKAFIRMTPKQPEFDKIIMDPTSGFLVIPLMDPKLQIIVFPTSATPAAGSMTDHINTVMMNLDQDKI